MKTIVITRRLSIREALIQTFGFPTTMRFFTLLFSLTAVPVRAEAVIPKSPNMTKLFQAIDKIRYAETLDSIGEIFAAETRLRQAGYLVRTVASNVRREPDALEEAAILDDIVSVLVMPPGTEAVRERVQLSLEGLASGLPKVAALNVNHLTTQQKIAAAAVDSEFADILLQEGFLDSSAHVIGEGIVVLKSVPGYGVSRAREELTDALIASVNESLTLSEKIFLMKQKVQLARRALERGT